METNSFQKILRSYSDKAQRNAYVRIDRSVEDVDRKIETRVEK